MTLYWNADNVTKLAALRAQNLSFSKCAILMGTVRNACIGAANRARTSGDDRFAFCDPVTMAHVRELRRKAKEEKAIARAAKPKRVAVVKAANDRGPRPRLAYSSPVAFKRVGPAPDSRNLDIWSLGPRDCRYMADDGSYCGNGCANARSYCEWHAASMFVRARPVSIARDVA